MKKCPAIENLLPLYSEGILSDAEKRVVEEHLSDCAACQKELAYLQKAGQLVNHLSDVEEPAWFQQKIMARVREEADKQSFTHKWFYPLRIKIPVQIMATIVIAVLAVYIYRSGDEQAKQLLPGTPDPAVEIQMEQAPPQMPQTGKTDLMPSVPDEKTASRKELKENEQVPVPAAAGGLVQKSEAPESKPSVAYEGDASRVKGWMDKKDKVKEMSGAKPDESARALPQQAEQGEKSVEPAGSATEKKKELAVLSAPAAPRVMEAATEAQPSTVPSVVTVPEVKVLIQVNDVSAAMANVEKALAQCHAAKVTKQPSQGRAVIRADISGKDWPNVFMKLKEIGLVKETVTPAGIGEGAMNVVIEISVP